MTIKSHSHCDALFNLAVAYQERAFVQTDNQPEDLLRALQCYEKVVITTINCYYCLLRFIKITLQSMKLKKLQLS